MKVVSRGPQKGLHLEHTISALFHQSRAQVEIDLHIIFVDIEKAYDKVPREVLWRTLKRKGVNIDFIEALKICMLELLLLLMLCKLKED